ncbi:MAG TPA: MurR/RpiR family transcriptional regulator [Chloroflexota bacterium]|nr:MurR/RpiR family transcriptional regulator [Chloroflexota bacterium]
MSMLTSPGPAIGASTGVLARLETIAPSLRESERKIAEYVLSHAAELVYLSITELADRTDTSEATVIRFAQRLGYPGYAALKIALALDLHETASPLPGELTAHDDVGSVKRKVIEASVESLNDTARLLDDDALRRAVDAIESARRIEVYGVGGSAAIAQDAYSMLMQIGLPIGVVTDPHLQVMSAVQLRRGDVALAISVSGSTRDTIEALQTARDAGATCICLTRHLRSPITRVAHVTLLAAARPTMVGGHQLNSRVAQLAVIDVLATATALRRQDDSLQALARGRQAISKSKRF